MRIFLALLASVLAQDPKRWYPERWLANNPDLSFDEFKELWPRLRNRFGFWGMGHGPREDYIYYQRERYLYGNGQEPARKAALAPRSERNTWLHPANEWDKNGICPDQAAGLETWDYDESTYVIIENRSVLLDRSVDIQSAGLLIRNNGKLIFKDNGEGSDIITLRAKSIQIHTGGELWIGSRSCRYQGNADIVLYGNEGDHAEHNTAGYKYLHVASEGTLEMHGKEKMSWTTLDDHIFRNNVPAEQLNFWQTKGINLSGACTNFRLVVHVLSQEGDFKDYHTVGYNDNIQTLVDAVNGYNNNEIFIMVVDYAFPMSQELRDLLVAHGVPSSGMDDLLGDETKRLYSQFGALFNKKGQGYFASISPADVTGEMHQGLKADLGYVDLDGMKAGLQFGVQFENNWWYSTDYTVTPTHVQAWMDGNGFDDFPENFKNTCKQIIRYGGPDMGAAPILQLTDDASSWEVGDRIVVTATHFDPNESEVFTLVDCPECTATQVKVDRTPTNTHWGRIDIETGADQRAQVGLLTRNVRFYGEMDTADPTCKYARTREQTQAGSPNADRNYCSYYTDVQGFDQDLHGAHSIVTKGFSNFHVSHVEYFNAGQPHVGRYPIHWHFADYVGHRGGYEDPSSVDSVSIHDTFSRWITVHGTHEATVNNCVGYNTFGHGFFLEDGYESYNWITNNLGILVKPGIILPSERSKLVCGMTGDGLGYTDYFGDDLCEGLAVFWFANIHNYVHNNVAVGGNSGYWLFTHSAYWTNQFDSIPFDAESGRREWKNNKACCASRGFSVDESILDEPPSEEFPSAQFSIGNEFGYRFRSMNETHTVQPASVDNRPNLWAVPKSNWAELIFDGLNCHHTNEKNWARGANMFLVNSMFSDNTRAWINKGTAPTPGARKLVYNTTFIGYTRNTGHRICKFPNGENTGWDLAQPRACEDTRRSPIDLIDQRPQTDVLSQRRVYWHKTDDVYRLNGQHYWYPIQGASIYDTFIPGLYYNVTFWNYPAKEGPEGPARHALGVQMGHKHALMPKSTGLLNVNYINVDRYWQNAIVGTDEPQSDGGSGDFFTWMTNFGDDFKTNSVNSMRTITDGEMNTGYTDLEGRWTDGAPAYIFNPAMKTVNTDCKNITYEDNMNIGPPGIKVCPITTPYASWTMRFTGGIDPIHATNGRQFWIQTHPLADEVANFDELTPNRLVGAENRLRGGYYTNLEAFKVHKMWWTGSQPQTNMHFEIEEFDPNTWYRFSVCLGTGVTFSVMRSLLFNYGNDLEGQGWPTEHTGSNSLEAVNAAQEDTWWYDSSNGWLHIKMVLNEDRTTGGEIIDRQSDGSFLPDWPRYQCAEDKGWSSNWVSYPFMPEGDGTPFTDIGLGTGWRSTCHSGEHQIEIGIASDMGTDAPVCPDFEVIATRDLVPTTATTGTTASTTVSTLPTTEATTTQTTTTTTQATTVTTAATHYECGPRIRGNNVNAGEADLGLFTFAMDGFGNYLMTGGFPYYKQEGGNLYLWWMWHDDVGHWVINETPGAHGDDKAKSDYTTAICPQDTTWSLYGNFNMEAAPCCNTVIWTRSGVSGSTTWTKTSQINEEYPVYEAVDSSGNNIYMWWMWHDPVGHWVINKTPGAHGQDIIKSTFAGAACPEDVAGWEDPNFGSNTFESTCAEPTTPAPTTTEAETTTAAFDWDGFCANHDLATEFNMSRGGWGVSKIRFVSDDTAIVQVNMGSTPETEQYTMGLFFARKYCGPDFLAKWEAGELSIDFADKESAYSNIFSYVKNSGSSSAVVVQMTSDAGPTTNVGNTKRDVTYMIISGLSKVDFGAKTWDQCMASRMVVNKMDAVGSADYSGCLALQRTVGA